MLRKPLDERLDQPLNNIETWLGLVQPALKAARNSDDDDAVEEEYDYVDSADATYCNYYFEYLLISTVLLCYYYYYY
jgi:hypothetical protein